MFDMDLTNMTTDEIAEQMLDGLRIANETTNLENSAPSDEARKFLAAVRKVAREDAVAVADAFITVMLDYAEVEHELASLSQIVEALVPGLENLKGSLDNTETAEGN